MKKFLKAAAILSVSAAVLLVLLYLILPGRPGGLMEFDDPYMKDRPSVHGQRFMASTGTPWATRAAVEIMKEGGNAVDAAVAALLVLNVTQGEESSFPCVAPVMIHDASTGRVWSYTGAGTAPAAATIELYRGMGHEYVPKFSMLSQLLPASPDVITAILIRFGTKSFSEVCAPAIRIAEEGFPVHRTMEKNLGMNIFMRLGLTLLMPYNSEVYLGGRWWRPLQRRERFRLPDLARTFRAMCDAEASALRQGKSRDAALLAVRDYFYRGPLAEKIVEFHKKEEGLFTMKDLSGYRGYWEEPLAGSFREYTIFANRTWCQGAVVPMVLSMLSPLELKSMGHNSPEYVHTVIQAIELAMADRGRYFGDPDFVDVPARELLSARYAAVRRTLMTPGKAFGMTPSPGDPRRYRATLQGKMTGFKKPGLHGAVVTRGPGRDTSYLSVVDPSGNAVSMTPSDFPQSPMVPGTGMTLGIRMTQFRLDPDHPSALMPGKRPTITPNASIIFRRGRFYMSFGTPGGDMQTQALVQVFLNMAVFGMDVQEAINAPRFRSMNWPDSFSPHEYRAGEIHLESSLYAKAGSALEKMGYRVVEKPDWDYNFSAVCAVVKDHAGGRLVGGSDPRKESWAEGE